MDNKVLAQTAPAPEGPWSGPVTLFQATPITQGSSIYSAAPQPQYDVTGKTLVVTFTNFPNVIQAINVVSPDTPFGLSWSLIQFTRPSHEKSCSALNRSKTSNVILQT